MSEQLRGAPESISVPNQPRTSPELSAEVEKIAQGVEQVQEVTVPGEIVADRNGEQWSGAGAGGNTGGTQAGTVATPVKDTRIVLPATVEGMQQLVRTQIQQEMRTIVQSVKKDMKRGKISAHELSETASKLRRLKGFLRNLLSFSREKLKEILFMFVSSSKFIDPEESKDK